MLKERSTTYLQKEVSTTTKTNLRHDQREYLE